MNRVVGPVGALSVVAGSMLGVGILLTPPLVAAAAPGLAGFAGLWVLGAVVSVCGGLAFAELGAMMPEAGGDYAFQRAAFGRGWALAAGVVLFGVAFAASIAAMSVALCQYQLQVLLAAALGEGAPDLARPVLGFVSGQQLAGSAVVVGLTALNAAGARLSTVAQTLLTAVPLVGLALLGAWGLWTGGAPTAVVASPTGSLSEAWLAVYFTFAGWPAIVYIAGEVRDPGRTLPLAVLGGTALVSLLYALLCAAFVAVLGMEGLAGAGEAGTTLATVLLGPRAGTLVAALVAAALLASVNGTVLGGARIAWAMARDLELPGISELGVRSDVPVVALWIQAVVAVVYVFTGTFASIMAWSSLAMLLTGSLTVLALFRLRRLRPEAPRPFRAWGYPWTALAYLASSATVLALDLWSRLGS